MEIIVVEFLFFLGLALCIGIYTKGVGDDNTILKNIGKWGSYIFFVLAIIGIVELLRTAG